MAADGLGAGRGAGGRPRRLAGCRWIAGRPGGADGGRRRLVAEGADQADGRGRAARSCGRRAARPLVGAAAHAGRGGHRQGDPDVGARPDPADLPADRAHRRRRGLRHPPADERQLPAAALRGHPHRDHRGRVRVQPLRLRWHQPVADGDGPGLQPGRRPRPPGRVADRGGALHGRGHDRVHGAERRARGLAVGAGGAAGRARRRSRARALLLADQRPAARRDRRPDPGLLAEGAHRPGRRRAHRAGAGRASWWPPGSGTSRG